MMKEYKDSIKVQVKQRRRKSPEMIKKLESTFGKGVHPYAYPIIDGCTYLSVLCNTEEKLANWIYARYGQGYYVVNAWGWIRRKNNPKATIGLRGKLFSVEVWNSNGKPTFEFYSKKGLRSYWWWRKPLAPMEYMDFSDEDED